MTGFQQRHGAHAHPTDAPGTGMACEIVGRRGRPRQDEATAQAGFRVAGGTNMGPHFGRELPFVEQPRRRAREHGLRCDARREPRARVLLEQHFAAREAFRRPRLTATPRPLHDHSSRRSKSITEIVMDHTGEVTRRCQGAVGHGNSPESGVRRSGMRQRPSRACRRLCTSTPIDNFRRL